MRPLPPKAFRRKVNSRKALQTGLRSFLHSTCELHAECEVECFCWSTDCWPRHHTGNTSMAHGLSVVCCTGKAQPLQARVLWHSHLLADLVWCQLRFICLAAVIWHLSAICASGQALCQHACVPAATLLRPVLLHLLYSSAPAADSPGCTVTSRER